MRATKVDDAEVDKVLHNKRVLSICADGFSSEYLAEKLEIIREKFLLL